MYHQWCSSTSNRSSDLYCDTHFILILRDFLNTFRLHTSYYSLSKLYWYFFKRNVLPVKKTAANPVLCTELSDSNSTRSAFASEVIMDGASWPQYTPCFLSLSEPILLYTSTRSYSHSAYEGRKQGKHHVKYWIIKCNCSKWKTTVSSTCCLYYINTWLSAQHRIRYKTILKNCYLLYSSVEYNIISYALSLTWCNWKMEKKTHKYVVHVEHITTINFYGV